MFLVEAKGKRNFWGNELSDDFIRFLPNELECQSSDLIIHWIPKSVAKSCQEHEVSGGRIETETGKIKKLTCVITGEGESQQETWQVVEEIQLIPLQSSWPYDNVDGNLVFLGIQI